MRQQPRSSSAKPAGAYVDRSHEPYVIVHTTPTWIVRTTLRGLFARADVDGQRKPDTSSASPADAVHAAAEHGTSGAAGALPHFDTISSCSAATTSPGQGAYDSAAAGATAMGAQAYATGDHVAFAGTRLHTAAHEAAHWSSSAWGAVKGGVGRRGRVREHADQVRMRWSPGDRRADPRCDERWWRGDASGSAQPARDEHARCAATQDHPRASRSKRFVRARATPRNAGHGGTPHSVLLHRRGWRGELAIHVQ